jgi:predicted transcriptional regulator of viral defense system
MTMSSAASYIRDLQSGGRYHFTTGEAARALGTSPAATRAALRRLKQKGWIADPYRGFHVIVPPEYRGPGCLPADQFIPFLMAHLGEPYYVGLLSAARYHGAGHQQPMVFQLVVPGPRRGLQCGGVRVEFIARKDMEATPVVEKNTRTGVIRIASPEATAIELVGYVDRCGYLDNVATVLTELAESMDGPRLALEALRSPVAWVQRLGYLLCLTGADGLAAHLDPVLSERRIFTVALAPWAKAEGAPRDKRWNVAVNQKVEPDL